MKTNNNKSKQDVYNLSQSGHSLHGHHGYTMRNDPLMFLTDLGINEGIKIVDLGCGSGFFSIPMVGLVGKTGTVYAVDSSQESLSQLRDEIKIRGIDTAQIHLMLADATETGIPERSVDMVFFANMFHDVENKEDMVEEVKRIMKPSAIAIDVDWRRTDTSFGPPMEIRIEEDQAISIFEKHGFKLVRKIDPDRFHYGLIFSIIDVGNGLDWETVGNTRLQKEATNPTDSAKRSLEPSSSGIVG